MTVEPRSTLEIANEQDDRRCRHGHLLVPENVYVAPNGSRNCRECARIAQVRWYAANPEKRRAIVLKSRKKRAIETRDCRARTEKWAEATFSS